LRTFTVQGLTVAAGIGSVGRLNRQFTTALQNVCELLHRTFGHLGQRDSVVGIAAGYGHPPHLGVHALADGQACSIVLGAVDTQTRRQTLHCGSQAQLRSTQVTLCSQRWQVRVDRGHVELLG